jgi:hypothetical protein
MNRSRQCRISSEASPQSLGRVFALLTLLNLVPDDVRAQCSQRGTIRIDLDFSAISDRDFDLLLRKVAQLTETCHVKERLEFQTAAVAAS